MLARWGRLRGAEPPGWCDVKGTGFMAFALGVVTAVAAVYLLLLAYLWATQRGHVFRPGDERPDLAGSAVAALMQETDIPGSDDLAMRAWYARARPGMPTILYLHGNAGTLGGRAERVLPYLQRGYGVLLAAYRGYGGNPGTPTELGLYADARAHFDWLLGQGVPAGRVVLYGESLGAAIAVQLAIERPAAALVLEAPFASVLHSARERFPLFAFDWLIKDKFASIDKIGRVQAPLFIVHGDRDQVTPMRFGRMLFDQAREPKAAHWPQGAGHNDLLEFGMVEAVTGFLERLGLAK
jgi:fermentation-respiration switch protein FrsA (DUF1100 family)